MGGLLFHIPVEETSLEASRKAGELTDFYHGGSSNIVLENFDVITDMFTDAFATYSAECFIEYAHLTQPVYQYCYVHQDQYGINTDDGLPKFGINHGDELNLRWDPIFTNHYGLNPEDTAMANTIISIWSTFFKTLIPEVTGVDWAPISLDNKEYLLMDNDSRMERSQDYQAKIDFWKQLFPC